VLQAELRDDEEECHSERSPYDEIPLMVVDIGEKDQGMTSTLKLYLLEELVFHVLARAWKK